MPPALLSKVLSGDASAIEAFGSSDVCAVIDWRDGLEQIIAEVSEKLPAGYLQVVAAEPARLVVRVRGASDVSLESQEGEKQEDLLLKVGKLLQPEFEMRQYRPMDGDGYALYLAPSTLWMELARSSPDALETYFLSLDRLAIFWRKSFLSRLFSKP